MIMGYGYGRTDSGRYALSCDKCGTVGGVRKRPCTFKVLGDTLRSAIRYALPYCPAPALCAPCLKALGGSRELHKGCKIGADASQKQADAIEAALDSGEALSIAAWGSWYESVPDGQVGVLFKSREGQSYRLVGEDAYHAGTVALSQIDSQPWIDHPGATSKEVKAG